ncbi:MAG: DUF92 domain-containing protein [Candidatus Micrarchaeia archaeon]|jgi:uncharacterized protein (TIGR00297 family)
MQFLTLDGKGIASALALALLILYFGKEYGVFFLSLLLLFLALSAIVTNVGKNKKRSLGLYEKSRGWKNVLANGLAPLLIAILFYFEPGFKMQLALAYVASVAAITADKFASEIGVLDGTPIMLLTMKRVDRGVSGAVTLLGLAASSFASFGIALASFFITLSLEAFAIVFVSGYMGNIVDSLLGYYEEKGIGNKFTTNLACALSGSLFALLFLALAGLM